MIRALNCLLTVVLWAIALAIVATHLLERIAKRRDAGQPQKF